MRQKDERVRNSKLQADTYYVVSKSDQNNQNVSRK